MILETNDTINSVSSLIQLAVAPVFLLAAVAGLLNVFTGRLSRIIDKVEKLDNFLASIEDYDEKQRKTKALEERRKFLTYRMNNTNKAIFFCTSTGLFVALVIVTMFFSALFEFKDSFFVAILFILAMISFIISLLLFLKEIYYTTSFIKSKKESLLK